MHAVALTQFVSLHSSLQNLQCENPECEIRNRNVLFQTEVSRRELGRPLLGTIRRRVSKASIRAAISANPGTRGTDGEEESIQRSDAITNVDVVVIGAGIGGLCCAALLAKYGYKVVVCESHDIAGGAGHAFERQGFQFDSGPSFHAGLSIKPSINPLKQVFMLSLLKVKNFDFSNPREASHSFNLLYLCRDMVSQGLLSMPDCPSSFYQSSQASMCIARLTELGILETKRNIQCLQFAVTTSRDDVFAGTACGRGESGICAM